MCRRNWQVYDEEGPDFPLPLAQPRLMWAIPVSMSELGASIEAYSDTIPQVTTLRLCHRFGRTSLSRLPQEIIEHVADEIRRMAYDNTAPGWNKDFKCFQNRCAPEDHYDPDEDFPDELLELSLDAHFCTMHRPDITDLTSEEKVAMIRRRQSEDPVFFSGMGGYEAHFEASSDFIERTCMCYPSAQTSGFNRFNRVLKSHFGLEAVILHETINQALSDFLLTLNDWTGTRGMMDERASYTLCYLTLAADSAEKYVVGGRTVPGKHQQFGPQGDHKAFQQVINPSLLALSENQHLRFKKAMRMLDVSPHYHLSELEPHIEHPIEDEDLIDLCTCSGVDCDASTDILGEDKAINVECYLEEKSKELAKESWPKLMMVAASDAVTPD